MNVREAAFLSLGKCLCGDKFSNLELDSAIKKYGFSPSDKAFFTTLVYGVIEKKLTLDYVIGHFSSKPIDKIEPKLINILRLGAYQIIYLDRTPDSAAVNESVELAKKHTHKGTSGFVNGILRNIARNKNALPFPDRSGDPMGYLSVKYSLPIWLCQKWSEDYGENKAEEILSAVNVNPPITLRVNTLKTTRDELLARLRSKGIDAEKTSLSGNGVKLMKSVAVSELDVLDEGLCYVQDEASQLCVSALGAKAEETVIDTCSCPGGKSFGIAMDMGNKGRLISLDIHESKLSLVKNGAEKLGISIIDASVHNGSTPKDELIGKADRVLTDAPCSGLGVIAKKPDLRHKSFDDISRLPDIQYKILCSSSEYVKSGGVLVYSTCTLNKDENERVVEKFLENNGEFSLSGEGMPFDEPMLTLFPSEHGTDGFFIAKMIRA